MAKIEWQVGMEVAVYRGTFGHAHVAIRKVARVMKRFVELSDGTRWNLTGRGSYPRETWDRDRIRIATDADRAMVVKQRCESLAEALVKKLREKSQSETITLEQWRDFHKALSDLSGQIDPAESSAQE